MQMVIIGATGLIGRPLCARFLQDGHQVTALSRNQAKATATLGTQVRSVVWGEQAGPEWRQAVATADVIVHLAGEAIGGERWTPAFKEKIRASRVDTTRMLVDVLAQGQARATTLVCASAVGYYGDRQDETITEEAAPGGDFLADVCVQWEAEAVRAEQVVARVARMRLGIVLARTGALEKMLYPLPLPVSPAKLGLGGPIGSGKQWWPWVHIDDVVGMFHWAATTPEVNGAVNVTAPNPVTNAEFTRALGRVLHRPEVLPIPAFVLRMVVGEFADTLLGGARVLPTAAERLGYRFQYPEIEAALRSLL